MTELDKKIKDLKDFIKQKTDQGTANYLGKEIREICGMVETEQLLIHSVVQQSELLLCKHCDNKKALHSEATGLCPDRFEHFEAK